MGTAIVNSDPALSRVLGDIREAYNAHHYLRITIRTGRDRTLDQNSVTHCWYEQVSNELREDSPLGVKRFCKLHFGVPILRAEDAEFREMYDAAIKASLSYEQKLKAMDFIDVTSIMSTKQLTAYMDEMRDHYDKRGVKLEVKETAKSKRKKQARTIQQRA